MKGGKPIDRSAIETEAARIFDRLNYHGDQGQTLWAAVAAVHNGLLPQHAIEAAISATVNAKGVRRCPVRYFRTVLAEKAELSRDDLSGLLRSVRVVGGLPKARPRRETKGSASVKRPPRIDRSDAAMNAKRNEITATLRQLG